MFEFEEAGFVVNKLGRIEAKLRLKNKSFPRCELVRGRQQTIPLHRVPGHVKCCNVVLLIVWGGMVMEKMFNLKDPWENVLTEK